MCKYTIPCSRANCNTEVNYSEAEVKDQVCKGLEDLDILQDFQGDTNQNMMLEEVLKFMEAKEVGKRLQSARSGVSALTDVTQT